VANKVEEEIAEIGLLKDFCPENERESVPLLPIVTSLQTLRLRLDNASLTVCCHPIVHVAPVEKELILLCRIKFELILFLRLLLDLLMVWTFFT
jgi:hypothetical protein